MNNIIMNTFEMSATATTAGSTRLVRTTAFSDVDSQILVIKQLPYNHTWRHHIGYFIIIIIVVITMDQPVIMKQQHWCYLRRRTV